MYLDIYLYSINITVILPTYFLPDTKKWPAQKKRIDSFLKVPCKICRSNARYKKYFSGSPSGLDWFFTHPEPIKKKTNWFSLWENWTKSLADSAGLSLLLTVPLYSSFLPSEMCSSIFLQIVICTPGLGLAWKFGFIKLSFSILLLPADTGLFLAADSNYNIRTRFLINIQETEGLDPEFNLPTPFFLFKHSFNIIIILNSQLKFNINYYYCLCYYSY